MDFEPSAFYKVVHRIADGKTLDAWPVACKDVCSISSSELVYIYLEWRLP